MTDSRKAYYPIALTAVLFLVGCNQQPSSGLATVTMQLGNKTFTLEVADKTESVTFGLMRRDSLKADSGMIFVFDREEPRNFWMKNVRFPLDIVFIDSTGRVVSVKQMKAYDTNTTPSDFPAQYAIELNEGAAADAGVKPGMVLKLPNVKAKE